MMMHVDDRLGDPGDRQPVQHMVDQRAALSDTSGFGIVSVSGRMRVPSPAASTIAVVTGLVIMEARSCQMLSIAARMSGGR